MLNHTQTNTLTALPAGVIWGSVPFTTLTCRLEEPRTEALIFQPVDDPFYL